MFSKLKDWVKQNFSELDRKQLQSLLDGGKYEEAQQLIEDYYEDSTIKNTRQLVRQEQDSGDLINIDQPFIVRRSKIKDGAWFIIGVLGVSIITVYFSGDNTTEGVVRLFLLGMAFLFSIIAVGSGYDFFVRKPQFVIDKNGVRNCIYQLDVAWSNILLTFIDKDINSKSTNYYLLIFKKNSAEPLSWRLNDLELPPLRIGKVVEQYKQTVKNKQYDA